MGCTLPNRQGSHMDANRPARAHRAFPFLILWAAPFAAVDLPHASRSRSRRERIMAEIATIKLAFIPHRSGHVDLPPQQAGYIQ
jgi:hypothetical protein